MLEQAQWPLGRPYAQVGIMPAEQSESSRQVSLVVWQKNPEAQPGQLPRTPSMLGEQ